METYHTLMTFMTVMAVICGVILFCGLLAWIPIVKGVYRLHFKPSKPIEHAYCYGKTFSLSEIRNEVSEFVRTEFDLDYSPEIRIVKSWQFEGNITVILTSDICGKIEYINGKITFKKDGQ